MNTYTIYHTLYIKSTCEDVFEAISSPEHLINWWPLKCSGQPILDTEYNFNFTDAYDWYGQVALVELNRLFFIKMTKSDPDWNPTTFGFEVEKKNDIVTVNFSHAGWQHCNQEFKHSSYCWALLLSALKDYVENRVVIPFEERS